jgi:hypothetical protein
MFIVARRKAPIIISAIPMVETVMKAIMADRRILVVASVMKKLKLARDIFICSCRFYS